MAIGLTLREPRSGLGIPGVITTVYRVVLELDEPASPMAEDRTEGKLARSVPSVLGIRPENCRTLVMFARTGNRGTGVPPA